MIAKPVNTFLKEESEQAVVQAAVFPVRIKASSLPDNPTLMDYSRRLEAHEVESHMNVMVKKADDANAMKEERSEHNKLIPMMDEERFGRYSRHIRGIRNMIASFAKYARRYHLVQGYLRVYWEENENAVYNRNQILNVVNRLSPPENKDLSRTKDFDVVRETRFAVFKEDDAARIIGKELETSIEFQLRRAVKAVKRSIVATPVRLRMLGSRQERRNEEAVRKNASRSV